MALRQLSKKLKPGTLQLFWQGQYTLQPFTYPQNISRVASWVDSFGQEAQYDFGRDGTSSFFNLGRAQAAVFDRGSFVQPLQSYVAEQALDRDAEVTISPLTQPPVQPYSPAEHAYVEAERARRALVRARLEALLDSRSFVESSTAQPSGHSSHSSQGPARSLSSPSGSMSPSGAGSGGAEGLSQRQRALQSTELHLEPLGKLSELGQQVESLHSQGSVHGSGTISGRPVYLFSSVGAPSHGEAQEICGLMDKAMLAGAAIISISDQCEQQGMLGSELSMGWPSIFQRSLSASGVVPQLSLSFSAATEQLNALQPQMLAPLLNDFTFVVEAPAAPKGHQLPLKGVSESSASSKSSARSPEQEDGSAVMVSGSPVLSSPLSASEASLEQQRQGEGMKSPEGDLAAPHRTFSSEREAVAALKDLIGFLPGSSRTIAPQGPLWDSVQRSAADIAWLAPDDLEQPCDMLNIIRFIVDEGHLLSFFPELSPRLVVGFARLLGSTVGVLALSDMDRTIAARVSRFVRFCDAFNLPLVTLLDAPGLIPSPGTASSRYTPHAVPAALRTGTSAWAAYAEATVPKVTLVVRGGHSPQGTALACKLLASDINLHWARDGPFPSSLHQHPSQYPLVDPSPLSMPDSASHGGSGWANSSTASWIESEDGEDMVIEPARSRWHLCGALASLRNKLVARPRKKHSAGPLL